MKKKEQQERDFERLVERQRQTIYSVCYLFANASASCIPFDRALILLWLEDLPYNEIAAILGISIDNVSVRLVRVQGRVETDKQKKTTNCNLLTFLRHNIIETTKRRCPQRMSNGLRILGRDGVKKEIKEVHVIRNEKDILIYSIDSQSIGTERMGADRMPD